MPRSEDMGLCGVRTLHIRDRGVGVDGSPDRSSDRPADRPADVVLFRTTV